MAKRGMPTKDKSGYYTKYLRLDDGSYKRIYGKTEKECREKYEAAYRKYLKGEYVKSSKATYKDWIEIWKTDYAINVKQSSLKAYESRLRTAIIPEFGNIKLQNITQQRVQKWVSSMQDKYSPATISNTFVVFQRTLNDAKAAGLIAMNPCDKVKIPKVQQSEMVILSKEEIPFFLKKAAECDPYYSRVFEFFLLTGIRKGELVGLTFDRFNPFEKTITIDRQFNTITGSYTTPKSNKSRTLTLPERGIELIETQQKWVNEARKDNPDFNPGNLIFPDLKGTFINVAKLHRTLKKVAKIYGKPKLRIHDLRHTYATLLLDLGVDIKTVQQNLGHNDAAFTLNRYGHSTMEMQRRASDKLDDLFL